MLTYNQLSQASMNKGGGGYSMDFKSRQGDAAGLPTLFKTDSFISVQFKMTM